MNTTKTKRLAAFLISLVMMLSLIPTQVWAAPTSERYGLSALSTMENSENLVWAYNTLDSAVAAGQETVPFTDETHAVSSNELDLVWEVYCYDHPEFFWLSAYDYEFGKGKVKNVFLTYALAGDELTAARTAFNAATEEALSGITADMDDLAKEIYLHDYLANKVTYVAAANAHNAYGALVEGQAVCEGYSRAFQHLLLQVGIPCYVVLGTGKGQPHMWNLVKINGEYYHVDLTWDDGNNGTYYAYFNVTTEQILENHTITEPIHGIPTPPCTATAANYFEVYGGKMASGDVDTICAMLDNPDLFARIYITGDPDAFLTWLQSNLEAIIDNANVSGNVSCSYNYSGREFQIHLYGDYAHTHNMTHVDALAATCQSEGNVEYWVCSKCNLQFADAAGTTELTNVKTEIDPTNHVGGTEIRDSIDASCERDGYTGDTYCLGCGIKLSSGTNTPKTHTTVHVDAIPATCKDTGTAEHWNCTSCGRNFADENAATELTNLTTPKDPNNHVGGTTIKNEAPATCTIPGNTGDTYCLGCDAKLSSGDVIPASHVMSHAAAIPATCKDTGTAEHWHCTVCSKDFADEAGKTELSTLITPKDATNHVGGTIIKNKADATCTVPGNTGDTYCLGCDTKLISGTVIPAGHAMNHVEAIPATCKDTGTAEHWHCTVCSKDFADEAGKTEFTTLVTPKDATNHVGGTTIKNKADATCTVPGNTGDTYCLGCDTKLFSGKIIPASHVMSHVDAVPATCKDTGTVEHWHCAVCSKDFADAKGKTELTTLITPKDPTNHVGGIHMENASDPNCTVPGNTGDTYCNSCNTKLKDGQAIPAGHTTTHVAAIPATCKDTGTVEHWHCSVCNKNFADSKGKTELTTLITPKDATNHVGGTIIKNKADATCTVPGNTGDTYCKGCDTKLVSGKIIPASHVMNHVDAVPATCKDTGTAAHWHCTVCDKNFADAKGKTELTTLVTPKDPSNHVGGTTIKNKTDATCTVPGNTGDTYCKGCDTKLVSGNVIPAGHVMNRVNAVPATCKDTGTAAHWHCSVCDKNFADSNGKNELTNLTLAIDPKNHVGETELRGKTAPTCKENGYTGDTYCLSCNEKIGTGTVIKTTHVLKLVPAKTPTCKEPGNKAYWLCSCGKIYDNDAEKTLLVSIDDCKLPVDPDNHVGFQTKWSMNADSHWHACTSCADGKSALAAHDYTNACDTTCNTCGYTREITHTPADNYSYDDNGHWKVCSVCGKTVEAIEGHKGGTATCIAKAICSVCNQPYGNLGSHNAENWRQTKAPTFTATGEKTGHCTVCDKDVITIVPMLTMPMDGKDSGSTKMSKSELTSVPAALTGVEKMDTLDEIRDALRKAIKDQKSSVSDSNIKFYDVSIMVAGPNGEYVPMTADNLPKNGEVTILMSYPEGTNKQNYAFYASHAITDARYGEVGSVEAPTVKATDAGLEITIHGASPVALGWYKTSRSNYSGATTVNQTKNSAATGDVGILAYILCGTGSLGLGAVLVNNKRRRH